MSSIASMLLLATAATAQAAPPRSAPVSPAGPRTAPSPNKPAPITSIGFLTAGELADRCQRQTPTDTNYCYAFIAGVHDTTQAYEQWLSTREFCPPAALTQSELRRSFITYVTAYPSSRAGVAASVIVVALKQTYPC